MEGGALGALPVESLCASLDVFQCQKLLTVPFLFKLAHFVGFLVVGVRLFFPSFLSLFIFLPLTHLCLGPHS